MRNKNDPLEGQREKLDQFVRSNFETLFYGANCLVEQGADDVYIRRSDYWAPRRVQIRETRLHRNMGLKIAGGHHTSSDLLITAAELRAAVEDVEKLLKAALAGRKTSFRIEILDE
jgi:hypothetical protein